MPPVPRIWGPGILSSLSGRAPHISKRCDSRSPFPDRLFTSFSGTGENFFVQYPKHLVYVDEPGLTPNNGHSTTVSGTTINIVATSGDTVATGVCGAYQWLSYTPTDQNGNQINNGSITFTESFSNFSPSPDPFPQRSPNSGTVTFPEGYLGDTQARVHPIFVKLLYYPLLAHNRPVPQFLHKEAERKPTHADPFRTARRPFVSSSSHSPRHLVPSSPVPSVPSFPHPLHLEDSTGNSNHMKTLPATPPPNPNWLRTFQPESGVIGGQENLIPGMPSNPAHRIQVEIAGPSVTLPLRNLRDFCG